MEWRILVLGPEGAGKTEAIRTISDAEPVSTEVAAGGAGLPKRTTTVAMDLGMMHVGDKGQVVLYGAPGQERFSFMWEILLDRVDGVVLLVSHAQGGSLATLAHYVGELRRLLRRPPPPLVVGITHTDLARNRAIDCYGHYLRMHAEDLGGGRIPVFRADARDRRGVGNLLLALTAMLEFDERLRSASGAA